MNAAVVRSFADPPAYEPFDTPTPASPDEMAIDVLAVGLHPRTRSSADGSHYASSGQLPMIPGFDGIGRDPDGRLRYFILADTHLGSMAEQVVVDPRRSILLPDGSDVLTVAAAMNPAMSSWIALRNRIAFEPGQSVLVLGATGNAGQMAVQIAKRLGARHVIAAGRDPERLAALTELGADVTVSLAGDPAAVDHALGEAASGVDVVIDYLWGSATERAMPAVLTQRTDRGRPLTWIEIGSVAGPRIALASAWLRAARIQIVGSGQGSVSTADIVGELPALAAEISTGTYAIDAVATPLSEVRATWNAALAPGRRVVFVP
ncbi:MAG TPA: zinc-binding alcohol dehydrogenase family protein [Solirubrobacteraceae bacterium]|jgi:NADPH:quinone reductase-like Zn-dependent oxidoreductase|nr:zinc-binding alcohol dehydrogenase family protein [Solirubrobacteraceae bacterium]